MSTKVYVAYKMNPRVAKNPAKFWQWVRDTQHRGEKEVQKVLRNLYRDMMKQVDLTSEAYKKHLGNNKDSDYQRLSFCHRVVYKMFREQAKSAERHLFDFDVSIAIRELNGDLYIIPYCDEISGHTLDFLKKDKRLSDFAYWDNTDPPRGMRTGAGYRRWQARGKVWDQLDANGWRDFLLITVCDVQKFIYVDPWLDVVSEGKLQKALMASAP